MILSPRDPIGGRCEKTRTLDVSARCWDRSVRCSGLFQLQLSDPKHKLAFYNRKVHKGFRYGWTQGFKWCYEDSVNWFFYFSVFPSLPEFSLPKRWQRSHQKLQVHILFALTSLGGRGFPSCSSKSPRIASHLAWVESRITPAPKLVTVAWSGRMECFDSPGRVICPHWTCRVRQPHQTTWTERVGGRVVSQGKIKVF